MSWHACERGTRQRPCMCAARCSGLRAGARPHATEGRPPCRRREHRRALQRRQPGLAGPRLLQGHVQGERHLRDLGAHRGHGHAGRGHQGAGLADLADHGAPLGAGAVPHSVGDDVAGDDAAGAHHHGAPHRDADADARDEGAHADAHHDQEVRGRGHACVPELSGVVRVS